MEYSIKPKILGERRIIHYPQKRIIGLYVYIVARTGRPKSDNPKKTLIGLKLTEEEAARLKGYASKHDMTITQVLQRGIDMQYAMDKPAE